jgi:3-hydroxyacyl-[acyl-carrier-protein] dehydratase
MKAPDRMELDLGPDLIERLLPHRPPFVMVDRIVSLTPSLGELETQRFISGNEPVFAGHFPGLKLWPGVYTLEGLAQSCNALLALLALVKQWESSGRATRELTLQLKNLELGCRLDRGHRPQLAAELAEVLAEATMVRGVLAELDVKLLRPVTAGCRLDFRCRVTRAFGELFRFDVEAATDRGVAAKGTVTCGTIGVSLA